MCFAILFAEYGIIHFKRKQTGRAEEPRPFPGWRNLCARILRKAPERTYSISTLKKKALRLISSKYESPLCTKTKSPLTNAEMLTKLKSQLRKSPRLKYNSKEKTVTLLVIKNNSTARFKRASAQGKNKKNRTKTLKKTTKKIKKKVKKKKQKVKKKI